MGKTGEDAATETYYAKWNDIDIIFHMAPGMSAEQHRRLCGNDIGTTLRFSPCGRNCVVDDFVFA